MVVGNPFFFVSCQHNHPASEEHRHHDGEDEEDEDEHEHENSEEHRHDDGEIHISAKQAERLAIAVDTVRYGSFRAVLKSGGRLLSNNGGEISVTAPTSGVITTMAIKSSGSSISKGTQLATLSPKDESGNSSYQKAYAEFVVCKNDLQRADTLLKDQIISQKRYDEIKSKYDQAKNALSSCNSESVSVKAPQSGFLKSWMVRNNEYVQTGQTIAVIANSNKLQLVAEVPECGYAVLPTICTAHFRTSYDQRVYALDSLNGRLLSYGKSSNENSFVPISFEFDNVGDFLSDSYVEVFLLGKEEKNVLTIPLEAVTEEQGLYFVYLRESATDYVKVPVRLGENDGLSVRILDGLVGGELLVVKGAFMVKMASMSSNVPEGHNHNH